MAVPHNRLTCYCRCHSTVTDDGARIVAGGRRADPVAAAASCDVCRHLHTPALSDHPPEEPDAA